MHLSHYGVFRLAQLLIKSQHSPTVKRSLIDVSYVQYNTRHSILEFPFRVPNALCTPSLRVNCKKLIMRCFVLILVIFHMKQVLLTGPCPRSRPALSLLSDPPTRCHRRPSNQAWTFAKRFKSRELFIIIFLIDWCIAMLALTSSLLMTSSCSQMVFTIRGSTGLAVTLSMLPLPLLGRDDVSLLIVFVFVEDPRSGLAAPSCHLLQLTPSRELMSTVFAARPGDRFSKDSKACNCNHHYSLLLDPQPWSRPSRALWSWQWTSSAPPARTRCPSTSGCPCDCRPPPAVDYDWRKKVFFSSNE